MRILFLASEFPFPPTGGGAIKTLSILDYLRRDHDVSVLCFSRSPLAAAQERWAAEAGVVALPLRRGRNLLNLLRSYLSGVPLSIERNRSARLRELVRQRLLRGRPDAVFVDGWLMAQYLPPGFSGLKLLHEHNAEHVLWRRQAELERNPARRLLVRRECARVRRYEAAMLRRFDCVFAVSEPDRRALIALGADAGRLRVLPNLPDASLLERPPLAFAATEPLIFYFGTLSWQPNTEGIEHFVRDVFPLVRREIPQARFAVAGRGAPPSLERLLRAAPGVEYTGPVADAEPFYRRARVFVEATRSGGGTKLKVLNALARGLPAVVSPQAAEGIEAAPEQHLLIADGPYGLAAAAVRLLTDGALWAALSANGRELIRSRYVAAVAYAPLDEVLSGARATA
ncbi:MAG: glycosyltransferase family 4 protein [Dehalococcoidia bacterium]|nr:glycosyltransferase family 4 protein [Dehalococcoidia bacterium]